MSTFTESGPTPATDRDVEMLAERIHGSVLTRGSDGYGAVAAGYNLAATRRPDLIVRAAGTADVVTAVRFAADHAIPVAVMSTGHYAGRPLEEGLLIVTDELRHVHVDAQARRAQIGAGAVWSDVLALSLREGLAPLHGSSPQVGVVGFSLGGGISPTMGRAHGWAVDHVTGVRLVLADGTLVEASADENPDLFWAVRGGRGNIGIVTALEVELFPVGAFAGGGLFYDGVDAEAVVTAWRDLTDTAPDELTTSIALLRMPAVPGVPELLAGRFVIHVRVAFLGSAEGVDELLRPLRAAAPTLADTVGELPYESFASIHSDPVDPAPFVERSSLLKALDDDALAELLRLVGGTAQTGVQIVELRHLGGALGRTPDVPSALENRDARFALWVVAVGMPADRADGIRDADEIVRALTGWGTGRTYLNTAPDVPGTPLAATFSAEAIDRLRSIKRAVDPQNLFRLQQPLD